MTRELRNGSIQRLVGLEATPSHLPCLPRQQCRWQEVAMSRIGMMEADSAKGNDLLAKRAGRPAAFGAGVFRSRLASFARPAVITGRTVPALLLSRTAGYRTGR
jgi:hypothetical protein